MFLDLWGAVPFFLKISIQLKVIETIEAIKASVYLKAITRCDRRFSSLVRHNIPIGLHANLSEGVPVCQSLRQASTLINQRGLFRGKMGFRQALESGQLSMKQVRCSPNMLSL